MSHILGRRSALALLGVAFAGTITGCDADPSAPDVFSTPDDAKRAQTVDAVMGALHASDSGRLVSLAGPDTATEADAAPLIARWGGVSDKGYSVSYPTAVSPRFVTAQVSASDRSGNPVTVSIPLGWHREKWLLVIGHASAPTGASHPAKPTP